MSKHKKLPKAWRKWVKKHGVKVKKFKLAKTKPEDLVGYQFKDDKGPWVTPRSFHMIDALLRKAR